MCLKAALEDTFEVDSEDVSGLNRYPAVVELATKAQNAEAAASADDEKLNCVFVVSNLVVTMSDGPNFVSVIFLYLVIVFARLLVLVYRRIH